MGDVIRAWRPVLIGIGLAGTAVLLWTVVLGPVILNLLTPR